MEVAMTTDHRRLTLGQRLTLGGRLAPSLPLPRRIIPVERARSLLSHALWALGISLHAAIALGFIALLWLAVRPDVTL